MAVKTKGTTEVAVADIVGLAEIAELQGVDSATIATWMKRYDDFPLPVKKLRSGTLFDRRDIRDWLIKTGRIPEL